MARRRLPKYRPSFPSKVLGRTHRTAQHHHAMAQNLRVETLEERMLLVNPQLAAIIPNAGDILTDGDVLPIAPRELTFRFGDGQEIDPSTLNNSNPLESGILITRAGLDGSFEHASARSDFGATGNIILEITAAQPGQAGNGIQVNTTADDLGDNLPSITVTDRTIDIVLNNRSGFATTATDLITAITNDAAASALVNVAIRHGDGDTVLAAELSLALGGANTAQVTNDFGFTNSLELLFQSTTPGIAGNGITLNFTQINLGEDAVPIIEVEDRTLNITLNNRSGSETSAQELITAINDSDEASDLIVASLAFGSGDASLTTGVVPNSLQTEGANDVYITPGYIDVNEFRSDEVIFRFAENLPDDLYLIEIFATGEHALQNLEGEAFDGDSNAAGLQDLAFQFELNLGAQVVAVVPQPVRRDSNGALSQAENQIVVYFNDDDLHDQAVDSTQIDPTTLRPVPAVDPRFYQLIFTGDTVNNTDDVTFTPSLVEYDPNTDTAVLTFADPNRPGETIRLDELGGSGVYRLRIGTNEVTPAAPATQILTSEPGSSFDSAESLGILGGEDNTAFHDSRIVSADIRNATSSDPPFLFDLPGSDEEPGHRDLPVSIQRHLNAPADSTAGITTQQYNFQDIYGQDPQGNDLHNLITENQKQRAREIFEIYGAELGIQFIETADQGFTIVTGDIRVLGATPGPGGVVGIAGSNADGDLLAILDNSELWDDTFGATDSADRFSWFATAMEEIGNLLGLGPTNELPPPTLLGDEPELQFDNVPEEVFPGDHDIVHGQHLFRPESKDIDLYQFELREQGLFTAETFAERLNDSSLLDTALVLYGDGPNGREVIARNDDYYSEDSFLRLTLEPGIYFLGVSASGNDQYNPEIADSGFGGVTEGDYNLRFDFRPNVSDSLTDATGTPLDGDSDGTPGGVFNFWFSATDAANTIFVDKAYDGQAGSSNGSLARPFTTIPDATEVAQPGDIVRIVGNGDATTAIPYEVGLGLFNQPLADGVNLEVPQGVTLMIDSGAVFKLQDSVLSTGSSTPTSDLSGGAIQVLGTPRILNDAGGVVRDDRGEVVTGHVFFTSYNDEQIGADTVSGIDQTPVGGDWGGLIFQNDLDRADPSRVDREQQGIFLNHVGYADIRYAGGEVVLDSVSQVISPIHLTDSRPTIAYNTISLSADAAISANPNTFLETNFHSPDFQQTPFTSDYDRVGPHIHNNQLIDNSLNALFVRVQTPAGQALEPLTVSARFDDTDIVHTLSETLDIRATPGGPLLLENGQLAAREDARLAIDPGLIVKLNSARIETTLGSQLIAEGVEGREVIFTSLVDDTRGIGGTFDTNNDGLGEDGVLPSAGDWGGLFIGHASSASIDRAVIQYAGGETTIEGSLRGFNAVEIRQARARIANTTLLHNADGTGGQAPVNRVGRGSNAPGAIYVLGAEPILVNNVIRETTGDMTPAITVNANVLNHMLVTDYGRSTGRVDAVQQYLDNQGALIRGNRFDGNGINGMVVRGATLTTQGVWDDTDIVHVVLDTIYVPDFHTFGGLRLESDANQSLVVKLSGENAGFTATGRPLDIDDRIGGSVQVVGQPGRPVILTSLDDNTVNAGFRPDGLPLMETVEEGEEEEGPTMLPTGPEVDNGTLIDNDVAEGISGQFAFGVGNGGSSGFGSGAPIGGISAQGNRNLFSNENVVFEFNNYIDIGGNGQAINLADTTITMPATLIADDLVASEGTFDGPNGTVNWRVESRLDDGIAIVFNTLTLSSTAPLGNLRFINYLDEDIQGVSDDLLFLSGTPGEADFRAFTLDGPERVGFSHGGIYSAGDGLVNATYDGWTADQFSELRQAIEGTGTSYTVAGNIDTTSLPEFTDSSLGQVFGLEDVTTAFAWSTDPNATTSTITSFLELIPEDPGTPAGTPGDWRGILLGEFSHDRNVAATTEIEAAGLGNQAAFQTGNDLPATAQFLGALATSETTSDDILRLGYEIQGFISQPEDRDVYSFTATAGTEVWLDIDRTTHSLDTVVELISADNEVLARSDNSAAEENDPSLLFAGMVSGIPVMVNPLDASPFEIPDHYTTNPRDAGMRVVLPGPAGTTNTYHVRVRSANENTAGAYQLQVRLRELDEVPGSTISHSDIRFATNAIEISGQPIHSPLSGEATEDSTNNDSFGNAQLIGNPLTSDRAAIGLAGELDATNIIGEGQDVILADVDWYRFTLDYDSTEQAGPFSASLLFDLDYADQLARANAVISIFDDSGNLVLRSGDSNIAEDLPAPLEGADLDDLSRGSVGTLDPLVGAVRLPEGEYFVAISANDLQPEVLDQFVQADAANPLIRLEPLDSVDLVAVDRGDGSGDLLTPNSIVPFALGDVVLFVSEDVGFESSRISTFDPFTGAPETRLNAFGFGVRDIAMRPDGSLFALSVDLEDLQSTDGESGEYLLINPGTGGAESLGNDGIGTFELDPESEEPATRPSNVGINFNASTFGTLPGQGGNILRLLAVGQRGQGGAAPAGGAHGQNLLYELNPNTGAAIDSDANPDPALSGAVTQATEIGRIFTEFDFIVDTPTAIRAIEATDGDDNVFGDLDDIAEQMFTIEVNGVQTTFEFDTENEFLFDISVRPAEDGNGFEGSAITDEEFFTIDGRRFEFDTGPSIIVTEGGEAFAVEGAEGEFEETPVPIQIRVVGENGLARLLEFDLDGITSVGNAIPIEFDTGFDETQIVDAIVATINEEAENSVLFNVTATTVNGRITLQGDADLQILGPPAGLVLSGDYGPSAGAPANTVLIEVEETNTEPIVGRAVADAINGVGGGLSAAYDGGPNTGRLNILGATVVDVSTAAQIVPHFNRTAGITADFAVPFLVDDTNAELATRMADAVNAALGAGTAEAQGANFVLLDGEVISATGVLTPNLGGPAPGGTITGTAILGNSLFAVTETGGLFEVMNPASPAMRQSPDDSTQQIIVTDFIEQATALSTFNFQGLALGPQNVEGGRFADVFFGLEGDGTIHAFDRDGALQPIFLDGATNLNLGIDNVNGLAFSTLDRNLWHITSPGNGIPEREGDPGHGINVPVTGSRVSVNGGASFHFGAGENGNYDQPGGAHGSLITDTFSLSGYSPEDQPTLYFNYFLETEGADGGIRDSFRVFVSDDSGNFAQGGNEEQLQIGEWSLVATNNSFRDPFLTDEFDNPFRSENNIANFGNVQELFDNTGTWRQARIPLDQFAGSDSLRLRFDFATAGSLNLGDIFTTGSELRALPGAEIEDGDTFTIDGATFEFDRGTTLVARGSDAINDGETFTINAGNGQVVFEFDTGNGLANGGAFGVSVPSGLSAIEVATRIGDAIRTAVTAGVLPGVTLAADDHRLTLQQDIVVAQTVLGNAADFFDMALPSDNASVATILAPAGSDIGAGTSFTINGVVFEFDNLAINAADTTTDVALRIFDAVNQAIQAGDLAGHSVFQVRDRVTVKADPAVTVNGGLAVEGAGGVAATNRPVFIRAGMSAEDVAASIVQPLADEFSNSVDETIKTFQDVVRVIGHTVTDAGPLGLADSLPGDTFGQFISLPPNGGNALRALDNDHEGVYVDDLIIGFAERGELVTGGAGISGQSLGNTDFASNIVNPDNQVRSGEYQFEIRRTSDFEMPENGPTALRTIDTNDRLNQSFAIEAPAGNDVADGHTFRVGDSLREVTFEFDDDAVNDGVLAGNIEISFSAEDTRNELAERIRDLINSPQVQAIIDIQAALSDGVVTGDASTSFTINLFGPVVAPDLNLGIDITQATTDGDQLRDLLLGAGAEARGDAVLTGSNVSAGFFTGGLSTIGIDSGIVLSTGDVFAAEGPNVSDQTSGTASDQGDADLDDLFGLNTLDTTSLEFSFELTEGNDLFFNFVFASEEYNEFANSPFNDVFAFLLDGENLALVPGTNDPISINTINGGNPFGTNAVNPDLYNNNDLDDGGGEFLDAFGFDGFTSVLTAERRGLAPGIHTIKLVISDVGDSILDSAVFLQANSFSSTMDMPDLIGIDGKRFDDNGDSNRFRDQGQIIIHSNRITGSSQFGIVADMSRLVDPGTNLAGQAVRLVAQGADQGTAVVGGGVEFTEVTGESVTPVAVDLSSSNITIDFSNVAEAGTFDEGDFTGYVITDENDSISSFVGATINQAQTTLAIDDSRLTVTANEIRIDVQGLAFDADSSISVDIEFDGLENLQSGPVRNLREINGARLIPGVTVFNNLLVGGQAGGIRIGGLPSDADGQPGAVPFARVLNNTIYDSPVGIDVRNNASPTVLNNVIAKATTAIAIDASSQTTVVAANLYQDIANAPALGDLDIALNSNAPLFVDAENGNFYLADNSQAIDSALDTLQQRPELVTVNDPLGIGLSPILAPRLDLLGQLRIDDPDADTPPGQGESVFRDRGAIERADFSSPVASLISPLDNDALGADLDPTEHEVFILGDPLTEFRIQLQDGGTSAGQTSGTGADPNSVTAESVRIIRINDQNGERSVLTLGSDYLFDYSATNNQILLTPVAGIWLQEFTYEVQIANQDEIALTPPAEEDIADGQTFTLDDGFGTPVITFEFDRDGTTAEGTVPIVIPTGATADQVASLIALAINGAAPEEIDPWLSATAQDGFVTVRNVVSGDDAQTAFGMIPNVFRNGVTDLAPNRLQPNQPNGETVFQIRTAAGFSGDTNPWHNTASICEDGNCFDVNNDGFVTLADANIILTEIRVGSREFSNPDTGALPVPPLPTQIPGISDDIFFVDVNNDQRVDILDALLVIDFFIDNNTPAAPFSSLSFAPSSDNPADDSPESTASNPEDGQTVSLLSLASSSQITVDPQDTFTNLSSNGVVETTATSQFSPAPSASELDSATTLPAASSELEELIDRLASDLDNQEEEEEDAVDSFFANPF